jgi:hypothetical protein
MLMARLWRCRIGEEYAKRLVHRVVRVMTPVMAVMASHGARCDAGCAV